MSHSNDEKNYVKSMVLHDTHSGHGLASGCRLDGKQVVDAHTQDSDIYPGWGHI